MEQNLEQTMSLVLQRLDGMQNKGGNNSFAEPSQNDFAMQGFGGDTFALALGAAFSGTIGGLFNSFINLGALGTIVGGIVLMKFVKGGFWHNFAKGVLVAGIAGFLGGIVGGIAGGILGGGQQASGEMSGVVF